MKKEDFCKEFPETRSGYSIAAYANHFKYIDELTELIRGIAPTTIKISKCCDQSSLDRFRADGSRKLGICVHNNRERDVEIAIGTLPERVNTPTIKFSTVFSRLQKLSKIEQERNETTASHT